MSLLIKGVDMPKNMFMKDYTLRVRQDGTAELIDRAIGKSYDVIDVPTPHGRLIDVDELMKVIEANDYTLRSYYNTTDRGMFTIGIKQAIDEAPTIIEAEE